MDNVQTSEHQMVRERYDRGAVYMMTYRSHIVGMEAWEIT
jgi:hypothetical protein